MIIILREKSVFRKKERVDTALSEQREVKPKRFQHILHDEEKREGKRRTEDQSNGNDDRILKENDFSQISAVGTRRREKLILPLPVSIRDKRIIQISDRRKEDDEDLEERKYLKVRRGEIDHVRECVGRVIDGAFDRILLGETPVDFLRTLHSADVRFYAEPRKIGKDHGQGRVGRRSNRRERAFRHDSCVQVGKDGEAVGHVPDRR